MQAFAKFVRVIQIPRLPSLPNPQSPTSLFLRLICQLRRWMVTSLFALSDAVTPCTDQYLGLIHL